MVVERIPKTAAPVHLSGYFDACATSPPAGAVIEAMEAVQGRAWGNPSSLHRQGLLAAEELERSRERLARALGARSEQLLFCSGGSEAAVAALWGLAVDLPPGRVLLSAVEHPAVIAGCDLLRRLGWELDVIPVDALGRIDLNAFEALLAPPTRLVSVIWGQNEIGTLAPVASIGALCRQRGIRFHTDAVQVVGHLPIDASQLPIDAISFSSHKLQGPRGIGAVLVAEGIPWVPLIGGGPQEGGRRGGTESVVLATGFACAVELAVERLTSHGGVDPIDAPRRVLQQELLQMPGCQLTGCPEHRLPHHISLLLADEHGSALSGRRIVEAMARRGIAISSGSACSSGHDRGSAVLRALGLSSPWDRAGIRLSLGPWLPKADLRALPESLRQARAEVARESR